MQQRCDGFRIGEVGPPDVGGWQQGRRGFPVGRYIEVGSDDAAAVGAQLSHRRGPDQSERPGDQHSLRHRAPFLSPASGRCPHIALLLCIVAGAH
jgi:hypothetical protein